VTRATSTLDGRGIPDTPGVRGIPDTPDVREAREHGQVVDRTDAERCGARRRPIARPSPSS